MSAAAFVLVATALPPAGLPAFADHCGFGDHGAGCQHVPDPEPDPPPSDPDGPAITPVDDGPQWSCTSETDPDRFQYADLREDRSIWAYLLYTCTAPGQPDNVFSQLACVARCPAGLDPVAPPPAVTPEAIRAGAYAEVVPIAPSYSIEPDQPVVGVPTFLHVPDQAQRQGTDVGGGFTVVVTATLTEVRWTLGDATRTCSTGGGPYTPAHLDRAMAQPDGLVDDGTICTFLFTNSSDKSNGGPLDASVQTVWDYSWSVNGTDRGTFNTGVTSPPSNFALNVREYQAIVTE